MVDDVDGCEFIHVICDDIDRSPFTVKNCI